MAKKLRERRRVGMKSKGVVDEMYPCVLTKELHNDNGEHENRRKGHF